MTPVAPTPRPGRNVINEFIPHIERARPERGGTGRRACPRSTWPWPCGFESRRSDPSQKSGRPTRGGLFHMRRTPLQRTGPHGPTEAAHAADWRRHVRGGHGHRGNRAGSAGGRPRPAGGARLQGALREGPRGVQEVGGAQQGKRPEGEGLRRDRGQGQDGRGATRRSGGRERGPQGGARARVPSSSTRPRESRSLWQPSRTP